MMECMRGEETGKDRIERNEERMNKRIEEMMDVDENENKSTEEAPTRQPQQQRYEEQGGGSQQQQEEDSMMIGGIQEGAR